MVLQKGYVLYVQTGTFRLTESHLVNPKFGQYGSYGLDLTKQVKLFSFNFSKAAESKQNKQEFNRTAMLPLTLCCLDVGMEALIISVKKSQFTKVKY